MELASFSASSTERPWAVSRASIVAPLLLGEVADLQQAVDEQPQARVRRHAGRR